MNMSDVNNQTQCGGSSLSLNGLAEYAALHNCILLIFGTLGNICVLWSVKQCPKTPLPLKLILMSIFLPVAIICLFTRPPYVAFIIAKLNCDVTLFNKHVMNISIMLYSAMAQVEIFSITVMTTFRLHAVWSSTKYELTTNKLKWILPLIWGYCLCVTCGVFGLESYRVINSPLLFSVIYFLPNVMLPLFYNLACYIAMYMKMRRHKKELNSLAAIASNPADQASRLVTVVFISNFIFGLPHAIYHVIPNVSVEVSFIVHIIYSIHFIVDPVVFFVFSENYRKVLLAQLKVLNPSGSKSASAENSTNETKM